MSDNQEKSNEFPAKYSKILKDLPEFTEEMDKADVETLKATIVICESNIYTIEKEKEKDQKYQSAKELCKEFAAPYRDAVKVQTAKLRYLVWLLENKGVDDSDVKE